MTPLGTAEEIEAQRIAVWHAQNALAAAELRFRALKGEPLLKTGDSFSVFELTGTLEELNKEFGARNLRMFG